MMRRLTFPPLRALLGAAGLALTALLNGTAAEAQRQPLVMAHGIRSDASLWQDMGNQLSNELPLTVLRATTPWTQPYALQASTLRAALGVLPDSSIAVGHSSGGLVLRQYAMQEQKLRGLLTVGSMHSGAPIAANIEDRVVGGWATGKVISMLNGFYAVIGSWRHWDELNAVYAIASAAGVYLATDAALNLNGFRASHPLWTQMRPGSGFVQGRNNSDSLARESLRAGLRASITSNVDPGNGWEIFQGMYGRDNAGTLSIIAEVGIYGALYGAWSFSDAC